MLSVEKFSRWLRAICTILLSRNSATGRTKAAGYVEQAVRVLQEHGTEDNNDVRASSVSRVNTYVSRPELSSGRTALANGHHLQYGH